jgi:hypothetical protein
VEPAERRWPDLPPRVGEEPDQAADVDMLIQELARIGRLDREQRGS